VNDNDRHLRLALRAYTEPARRARPRPAPTSDTWRRPRLLLALDTETETAGQALLFGSARLYRYDDLLLRPVGELLFHAEDLQQRDPEGLACLDEYAFRTGLPLVSRSVFCEQMLWRLAFKARAWVVGFNLPFDLSRLALAHGDAKGRFRGGFSFVLWGDTSPDGTVRENMFRPRLLIKALDSKRAFIEFARPRKVDWSDRIPDDSRTRKPKKAFSPKGSFLDARTLIYALTAESHSLASACELYEIPNPKLPVEQHGQITPEYIDYNRHDVDSTARLAERLLQEFAKHPINLQPTDACSPASVGKSYLDAMGVQQLRERERAFPREVHGHALGAYFRRAGRSRRSPHAVAGRHRRRRFRVLERQRLDGDLAAGQRRTHRHCPGHRRNPSVPRATDSGRLLRPGHLEAVPGALPGRAGRRNPARPLRLRRPRQPPNRHQPSHRRAATLVRAP
jgi:hypothetical protein